MSQPDPFTITGPAPRSAVELTPAYAVVGADTLSALFWLGLEVESRTDLEQAALNVTAHQLAALDIEGPGIEALLARIDASRSREVWE
jgi:hypothetical protein